MANTKAVIGGVLTGVVKENEILSTSGQLTIDDVDGEREFMPFSSYRGTYGTLSMTKDGSWTYQTLNDIESLQTDRPGIDEFSIAAKDGTLATIAITAYGTNDAPVMAWPFASFQFYEDTVRNGEITGASDRDHDPLRYELSTGPAHGAVTVMGATYSYTPNLDYVGQDSFIIKINDSHGGDLFYTVGVETLRVNDGPIGENNTVTIDHGDSYALKLDDFGFSDPRDAQWGGGNNLESVRLNSGSVNGPGKLLYDGAEMTPLGTYWILKADIEAGKLVWQSDSGATGKVEIGFYLEDDGQSGGVGGDKNISDAYTLTINSIEINDAPSFTAGANQTITEDSGTHIVSNWATLISAGPSNESAQALSFTVSNTNAALFAVGPSISAEGTLTYRLADNAYGSATVSVVLKDNGSGVGDNDNSASPVTFTITATGIDDAPQGKNARLTVNEDTAFAFSRSTFGFTDPVDNGANTLSQVIIRKITGAGDLMLGNSVVVAGQAIAADKLATLTFKGDKDGFGSNYASFDFAVVDNGRNTGAHRNTSTVNTITFDLRDVTDQINGTAAADTLKGTAGADQIRGGVGNDLIYGFAGTDTLQGDADNDRLNGGSGADHLDGGAGWDTASYTGASKGVIANFIKPSLNTNDASGDSYVAIENLAGSSFSDTLTGNGSANILTGGAGADRLDGGLGADTASYAGASTGVVANFIKPSLNTNDASGDSYAAIENLTGSSFSDALTGNGSANILTGGAGADRLDGGLGADTASYAGASTGVVASLIKPAINSNDASGDTYVAIENLAGSNFSDTLTGNSFANVLSGGFGDDRLTGGAGADDLYGGSGKDVFIFTAIADSTLAGAGRDSIFDFSAGSDRIDLTAIDASTRASGNQAFTFIGTQSFHGKAGELRYANSGSDTFVYGDVNGDGRIDFAIHIDSLVTLQKSDFLL